MNWISTSERQYPEPQDLKDECAEYYLVYIQGFGPKFAMFLHDENGICKWYCDYTSVITNPVTHWAKIDNPWT